MPYFFDPRYFKHVDKLCFKFFNDKNWNSWQVNFPCNTFEPFCLIALLFDHGRHQLSKPILGRFVILFVPIHFESIFYLEHFWIINSKVSWKEIAHLVDNALSFICGADLTARVSIIEASYGFNSFSEHEIPWIFELDILTNRVRQIHCWQHATLLNQFTLISDVPNVVAEDALENRLRVNSFRIMKDLVRLSRIAHILVNTVIFWFYVVS